LGLFWFLQLQVHFPTLQEDYFLKTQLQKSQAIFSLSMGKTGHDFPCFYIYIANRYFVKSSIFLLLCLSYYFKCLFKFM